MRFLILSLVFYSVIILPLQAQVGHKENDTLVNYIDINNKKQGKWVKRYDDGQIRYKGYFDNDEPVGTFFYYHPDGSLKSVLDYSKKDVISAELYWPGGKPAATGKYNKLHQRIGYWKIYFEDGVLSTEVNYINDTIDGFVRMFYPSGDKLLDCNYVHGVLTGNYTRYFAGGNVHESGLYKDNKKEGIFKIYDPEKNLAETGPYVQGMRHGLWYFYEGGKCIDTVK